MTNREPLGIPTGGRFAPDHHERSDVRLDEAESVWKAKKEVLRRMDRKVEQIRLISAIDSQLRSGHEDLRTTVASAIKHQLDDDRLIVSDVKVREFGAVDAKFAATVTGPSGRSLTCLFDHRLQRILYRQYGRIIGHISAESILGTKGSS